MSKTKKSKAPKSEPPKAKTPKADAAPKGEVSPKAEKKAKAKQADGKLSGLDAAAKVLAEAGAPLKCTEIVERALAKGYWKTNGQTPSATLYSAMLREINVKGKESRFKRTDKGTFALA